MALLANRVSALVPDATMASTSSIPSARAAPATCSNSSVHFSRGSGPTPLLLRISAPNFDAAEARGAGAVAGAHDLFRLPLAAIRRAPEHPMFGPGDGRARVPELRADSAVTRILQHAYALAVANLPPDLASELEIVPLVVD